MSFCVTTSKASENNIHGVLLTLFFGPRKKHAIGEVFKYYLLIKWAPVISKVHFFCIFQDLDLEFLGLEQYQIKAYQLQKNDLVRRFDIYYNNSWENGKKSFKMKS